MAPYLVLAATVAILASLGDVMYRQATVRRGLDGRPPVPRRMSFSFFDLLAVAALVAFAGLRYNVGSDYPAYVYIFDSLDLDRWQQELADSPQEIGFTAVMMLVKAWTGSPLGVFWFAAVLSVVPVYAVLVRYSRMPALSVTLFVLLLYVTSFNIIRQGIAVGLMFWAWTFLGRKTRWFVVLTAIAATMHVSALFAALAFVVARRWRLTPRSILLVAAVAVVAAVLTEQTPLVSNLMSRFNPRYADYLQSAQTGLGSYLMIAAFALLLFFAVYIGSKQTPLSDQDHQFAVYLLIGIAFMIAGTQAGIVFRMAFYFMPFALLLVPNRIAGSRDPAISGFLILVGSSAYYLAHLANYGDVIPYQTYLDSL